MGRNGERFVVDLSKLHALNRKERKRINDLALRAWHKKVREERDRSIFAGIHVQGFSPRQTKLFEIALRLVDSIGQVWDNDCNSQIRAGKLQYRFRDMAMALEYESERVRSGEIVYRAHIQIRHAGELAWSAQLSYKNTETADNRLRGKIFRDLAGEKWETLLLEEWNRYWKEESSAKKMREKMPFLALIA
jgi:hypothetical protein